MPTCQHANPIVNFFSIQHCLTNSLHLKCWHADMHTYPPSMSYNSRLLKCWQASMPTHPSEYSTHAHLLTHSPIMLIFYFNFFIYYLLLAAINGQDFYRNKQRTEVKHLSSYSQQKRYKLSIFSPTHKTGIWKFKCHDAITVVHFDQTSLLDRIKHHKASFCESKASQPRPHNRNRSQ